MGNRRYSAPQTPTANALTSIGFTEHLSISRIKAIDFLRAFRTFAIEELPREKGASTRCRYDPKGRAFAQPSH